MKELLTEWRRFLNEEEDAGGTERIRRNMLAADIGKRESVG